MISSHVKRSLLLWLHNTLHLLQQKKIKVKWFFIGVYIIKLTEHYTAAWRYKINVLFTCSKIFHLFAALTRGKFFKTLGEISYLCAAIQYPLYLLTVPLVRGLFTNLSIPQIPKFQIMIQRPTDDFSAVKC